ncbi:MAG: redoxin domain-containing protein [Candidatus Poribacteria bacterium]|nr:redoxin domain-containing protein [Candidatus Poribacteria bacterium]
MRTAITSVATSLILAATITANAAVPKIGETVDDFVLIDVRENAPVSLTEFDKAKAVVVMFISTECPVSNAYNERMVKLHEDYKEKGIQIVALNSNMLENGAAIVEHSNKHKFEFPVLKDPDNKIADRFEAKVTPEVYLLEIKRSGGDQQYVLRYHGAIDDSQAVKDVQNDYLRAALDTFLSGKKIAKTETKALGCTIKRVKKGESNGATP